MGFVGGVQCAESGLRRWDLRPCTSLHVHVWTTVCEC